MHLRAVSTSSTVPAPTKVFLWCCVRCEINSTAPGTVIVISTIGIPPLCTASVAKCASSVDDSLTAGMIATSRINCPLALCSSLCDAPQTGSSVSAWGRRSPPRANHAYRVGRRKILNINPELRPPTITIANGRWESDPIPCDVAAGSKPSVATSIVMIIGRSLKTAPQQRLLRRNIRGLVVGLCIQP
jgi:hypothetical protein